MGSDPQPKRLATSNAGRQVLWLYTPKVREGLQLYDSAKGRRIDKRNTVAFGTREVPTLVEKLPAKAPIFDVAIRIERSETRSAEQAPVRCVALLWRHELNAAMCRPA